MADETTIIKGAIEDHMGRVLHPETEGDQVVMENGKLLPTALQEIIARFANYLPLNGGTVNGNLKVGNGKLDVFRYANISAGSDGTVMFSNNAYIDYATSKIRYSFDHPDFGARGLVMRYNSPGIWYFDTGNSQTVANQEFTPTLISMTDKRTELFTGDLNNVTENMVIDGQDVANAPGTGWYYIVHISHSNDPVKWSMQLAFSFHNPDIRYRIKRGGEWSGWNAVLLDSTTPTHYYSTVAPTAADGKDGDVWDVYE